MKIARYRIMRGDLHNRATLQLSNVYSEVHIKMNGSNSNATCTFDVYMHII